ncbi:hypothetical protein QQG55_36115 [Brugia pahangi]
MLELLDTLHDVWDVIEKFIFLREVAMGMNEIRSNNMKDCMVYGHHLSPYDIQQTVFDSTDKTIVFYAYYIEPV